MLFLFFGGSILAQTKVDSLLQLLKSDSVNSEILCALSEAYVETDYEQAHHYAELALLAAQKNGYKVDEAKAYYLAAKALYRKGDLEAFPKLSEKSLAMAKELNKSELSVENYILIATSFRNQGKYEKAISLYLSAVEIAEKEGLHSLLSYGYSRIGDVHLSQEKPIKARAYYLQALSVAQKHQLSKEESYAISNLGTAEFARQDYAAAISYYLEALSKGGISSRDQYLVLFPNIANCYSELGEYEKAEKFYYKSLNAIDSLYSGFPKGKSGVLSFLGILERRRKNYSKSLSYHKQGLKIQKENGFLRDLYWNYHRMSVLYESMGVYDSSLYYYKEHVSLSDSLLGQETQEKIARLEAEFELSKKENAIAILTQEDALNKEKLSRKNTLMVSGAGLFVLLSLLAYLLFRAKKQSYIKNQLLQERRLLRVQMNPHFIFNVLMSAQAYIYQNKQEEAVEYISDFSSIMRTILENTKKEQITLDQELAFLNSYLRLQRGRFNESFDYSIDVSEAIDMYHCKIPPMLVQPFIENSIEHGRLDQQENGKISLHFEKEGDDLVIKVEDNGVGISSTNSTSNLDKEHRSMAISITKQRLELLNKHNYTFELSDINPGTLAYFKIPYQSA